MQPNKTSSKTNVTGYSRISSKACLKLHGKFLSGYGYGSSQSIVMLTALQEPITVADCAKIKDLAGKLWENFKLSNDVYVDSRENPDPNSEILNIFIEFYYLAHKCARWPLFRWCYYSNQPTSGQPNSSLLVLPWWSEDLSKRIIEWSVSAINEFLELEVSLHDDTIKRYKNYLQKIRQEFISVSCQGVNMVHLVRDAAELTIPVRRLLQGSHNLAYRFGEGVNAKLFNSTITSETSSLGVAYASSKSLTAAILANHGIPVPKHGIAKSESEAIRIAQDLGYPLVVKPDNRDGGLCVFAGINNQERLLQCFRKAKDVANKIIIQSHIDGSDYRITIFNDKIIKIIRRVPGGVLGDGVSSISNLVSAIQSTRAYQFEFENKGKFPLELDDEAKSLLADMGLSEHSVPLNGKFIPLRRKANISSGGTQHVIDPSSVHPDNLFLARRCASALYLDIAGVDLILLDHASSWIETNGAILEVNAQPQIGIEGNDSIYKQILKSSIDNHGHIFYYLLIGHLDKPNSETELMLERLANNLSCDGFSSMSKVVIRKNVIAKKLRDGQAAARLLLNERSLKCAISYLSINDILNHGLPTNRIKSFWILNDGKTLLSGQVQSSLEKVSSLIQKNCSCPPIAINSIKDL